MAEKENIASSPTIDEQTIDCINMLCKFILVYEDNLEFEKSKEYIKHHIDNNITLNGDKYEIRFIVQNHISKYVEDCPSTAQLFAFASDNNYQKYKRDFQIYYYKHYYSIDRPSSSLVYPPEFGMVFDCIQEAIDFHTLYEKFSIKMSDEAVNRAISGATEASEKAAIAAKTAAKNALSAANSAADKAVEYAINQVISEKKIEKRISENVDKQMNRVTSRISETSVTILGIFSGIVLTVVAGLFYSSSVLENINATNFFRLLCVASLVGLVCYNLLVVMFRFIEKFKNDSKESNLNKSHSHRKDYTLFITILLLVIFIVSCILQFYFPTKNSGDTGSLPTESKLNIDVVIDSNEEKRESTSSSETVSNTEEQIKSANSSINN